MQKSIRMTEEHGERCAVLLMKICSEAFDENECAAEIRLGPRVVRDLYELYLEINPAIGELE